MADAGVARCSGVMWRRRGAVAALILLLAAVVSAAAVAAPTIKGVRIGEHDDATRLILDITQAVHFDIFTQTEPDRVVIDMPPVRWALPERTLVIGRAGVEQVRYGSFRPDASRIVLELSRPLALRQARVLAPGTGDADGHRLVLDLVPVSPEPFLAATKAERRVADGPTEPTPLPPERPCAAPECHTIAIDAGHGGHDPGAMAADKSTEEKTITLGFALELLAALEATGRYRGVMTRSGDYKVPLHRRVEIARAAKADLFLSIHADHLDDSTVHGASVYTFSDEASDEETAALAARENNAGIDLSKRYDKDTTRALFSMAQRNTMNCSAVLAGLLLPELERVAPLVNRPHRTGDFRVLKAPDIPSVLIELGFLSNDQDLQRLHNESHRAALAVAIVGALDTYFRAPCQPAIPAGVALAAIAPQSCGACPAAPSDRW